MSNIKLGSHVGMAGKEMFLASAKEAVSYGANVFMLYTGAPQNTRRKEISELNIEAGWKYAKEHGIEEIIVHAPYIINLANTIEAGDYELGAFREAMSMPELKPEHRLSKDLIQCLTRTMMMYILHLRQWLAREAR